MTAHPRLTDLGDRVEAAAQTVVTIVFWLLFAPLAAVSAAVLGTVTFLALLDFVGRWFM